MDDQRTPLPADPQEEVFLNLLYQLQSARMDDQRASLYARPLSARVDVSADCEKEALSEEEFVDLLFRCQVKDVYYSQWLTHAKRTLIERDRVGILYKCVAYVPWILVATRVLVIRGRIVFSLFA